VSQSVLNLLLMETLGGRTDGASRPSVVHADPWYRELYRPLLAAL